jgi:hypothetical protein
MRYIEGSTYSILTPWSRVPLEKLTDFLLVKKFPAFYETRRFNAAVTSARHLPYPKPSRSSQGVHKLHKNLEATS